MAQEQFKINGVTIAAPSSYAPVFATTSTEDSDRTMDLVMHNTPIGTIAGYDMEWELLEPQEVTAILRQVLNRPQSTWHYYDFLEGRWKDADFYASNFNASAQGLEEGFETWDSLSFNIRSIRPV